MSNLLEWRSEATVKKLQMDLNHEASSAPRSGVPGQETASQAEIIQFMEMMYSSGCFKGFNRGITTVSFDSVEQQSLEHAKLEMEAKAQEEKVRKELQLKSAELAATNKALLEAKQQHLGTKDHADLLEKSCRQLQSEYESSEALIATQREEHATQQKQLQKMTSTMSASTSDRAAVLAVEQRRYEELKLTHEKTKHAMMSQEQQSVEHAKLEMEAKAQEEKVRKELQLKSAELAATNKALLEAKQQHLGTKDHADLLEKSCRQLQSEYESSEALIATQREEHATQQKQLQKMTSTMSASTSDRAAVLAVEQRRYEELKLTHEKMKHAMMSQEQQSVEHAKLEMEAKAQEEKVRKELQLKSAELAATNKALLEATSQNHSDRTDTSPLSPVSFQDGRFEPTDSIKPEGAGMAALRRVRGNITKPSNTQAETSTDGGLKATTAALQKLRAITAAKASGSSSPEAETTEISPKSPPVVLHAAAQRAKASNLLLKALKTASNEAG
eukprot:symbB.v1.2.016504.t1/scaffold1211.1/size131413/2